MEHYNYYMTQRPPMPGAMPMDGLMYIDEFVVKTYCEPIECEAYARVTYSRELTAKEISDYELIPESITWQFSIREMRWIVAGLENLIHDLEDSADESTPEDMCLLYGELKSLVEK